MTCLLYTSIALRSLSDDMPITKTLVKERKSDIIRTDYENVLEIMDPRSGFDAIGGMDSIKAYFKKNVINPVHRGDFSAVPMGVLLSGAPGAVSYTHLDVYKRQVPSFPMPCPVAVFSVIV